MHGATFQAPSETVIWDGGGPFYQSPWCGSLRAQRVIENLFGVAMVAVVVGAALWALRRRRAAVRASETAFVAGGVIAALVGVPGPIVGLLFARRPATRRMFETQIGLMVALGVFVLLGVLDGPLVIDVAGDFGATPSTWFALIEGGVAGLLLLVIAYPLMLIRRPRPQPAAS